MKKEEARSHLSQHIVFKKKKKVTRLSMDGLSAFLDVPDITNCTVLLKSILPISFSLSLSSSKSLSVLGTKKTFKRERERKIKKVLNFFICLWIPEL